VRRLLALAAVALVGTLAAGCATQKVYEGPVKPRGDLARIDGSPALNAGLPIQAILRKVDKTEIGVRFSRVLVEPGVHELLVDCLIPAAHTTTRFELSIDVSAGDHYVLEPESAPGNKVCSEVRIRPH